MSKQDHPAYGRMNTMTKGKTMTKLNETQEAALQAYREAFEAFDLDSLSPVTSLLKASRAAHAAVKEGVPLRHLTSKSGSGLNTSRRAEIVQFLNLTEEEGVRR